jgi:hypothetical protein
MDTGNQRMSDVERYEERDAWIPVRADIGELAKQIAGTPFVGAFRGKPADVFGAILYGHELHLAPLQALQALDVIDGKPTLKAEALRALFFRDGHRLEVVAWDDKRCTVRAERKDGLSSVEVTYTMHDAQTAGLAGKKNWRTSPKSMLYARATAMAIKAVAPDIALGIDMSDDVDSAPARTTGTTVIQVAQNSPEAPQDVEEGELVEEPTPAAQDATDDEQPPEARLITGLQMRKLGALIGGWERANDTKLDRDERRQFIAELAGMTPGTLETAKDLTAEQASAAIDALITRTLAVDDRVTEPPDLRRDD